MREGRENIGLSLSSTQQASRGSFVVRNVATALPPALNTAFTPSSLLISRCPWIEDKIRAQKKSMPSGLSRSALCAALALLALAGCERGGG